MYKVHRTSSGSLNDVASCHIACFPDSYTAKLGLDYARASLEWFLVNENAFLLHIESDGEVIGYCGGFRSSYNGDGSTSGILGHAINAAIKGVIKKPHLIFDRELIARYPLIGKNILKKMLKKTKKKEIVQAMEPGKAIGLVVIGVLPGHRGKGYFEILMGEFENECRCRNAAKIRLTVKPYNGRAIAAYTKAGWQVETKTENQIVMFKSLLTEPE